jgi:hypothetical protein
LSGVQMMNYKIQGGGGMTLHNFNGFPKLVKIF